MVAAVRQPWAASHARRIASAKVEPMRGSGRRNRRSVRIVGRIGARDNYPLVLLLIVVSSLVAAVADIAPFPVPMPILFGGTLLYTLRVSAVAPRLQTLAVLAVIGGVGLAVGSAIVTGRTGPESAIDSGLALILVALTLLAVGRRLLRHHIVNVSTVTGALCIYLLVGLFFAFFFGFISRMWIGPFFTSSTRADAAEFIYFSFSTLTTLSYGDLVPQGDLSRMLAVTEALFGQMYLVTVVALLVSNFGRGRQAKVQPSPRSGRTRNLEGAAQRRGALADRA